MFVKLEFEMRDWVDQSWDELQQTILDYMATEFPMDLLMRQGNHTFDQRTGLSQYFTASEYYFNVDINALPNILEIRTKENGEQVLYGRVFVDVKRDGIVHRFGANIEDRRTA